MLFAHSCSDHAYEDINPETDIVLADENTNLRKAVCSFVPIDVNDDGCCIYFLPIGKDTYYEIDGKRSNGGRVVVCEGEELQVEAYEKTNGKFHLRCCDTLTCSCCERFDIDIHVEYQDEFTENPGCCRVSFEADFPPCANEFGLSLFSGISPLTLGPNATVIRDPLVSNAVTICGRTEGTILSISASLFDIENFELVCTYRESLVLDRCVEQ